MNAPPAVNSRLRPSRTLKPCEKLTAIREPAGIEASAPATFFLDIPGRLRRKRCGSDGSLKFATQPVGFHHRKVAPRSGAGRDTDRRQRSTGCTGTGPFPPNSPSWRGAFVPQSRVFDTKVVVDLRFWGPAPSCLSTGRSQGIMSTIRQSGL